MRLFRFVKKILEFFGRGQYSRGLIYLAGEVPDRLFKYNAAYFMVNRNYSFPDSLNPAITVKIAGSSDIESIATVSGMARERISAQMNSGAICFISYNHEGIPSAVTWSAHGRIFVRGLGFEYAVPENGAYSYAIFTAPHARRQGHFLKMESEKIKYESRRGVDSVYSIIEFDNEYSYAVHQKLGFENELKIIFVKLFCLKLCHTRDLKTGKSSARIFIREPSGRVVII